MKSPLLSQLPPVRSPLSRISRISRLLLLSALLCSGCTILTYESPQGEHFVRSSLGSKTSIAHLSVQSATNGMHKVDLRGYKDDNTEALGTITDAAVRAAIAATAKP